MKPASLFFAKPARRVLRKLPTVFAPTEDLVDALSDALADDIAGRTGGAPVDCGATVALEVLSDVRRDAELSTSFDEAADVVALVTADGDSARGRQSATCSWSSTLRTCEANDVNPIEYLRDVSLRGTAPAPSSCMRSSTRGSSSCPKQ